MVFRKDLSFKIIIAGDGAVGKSTLVKRLVNKEFRKQKMTVGLGHEIFKTRVNGVVVRLVFWDLGGQSQFHGFQSYYSKKAAGYVLVFDVSRPRSFYNLDSWLDRLAPGGINVPAILIGNKIDLVQGGLNHGIKEQVEEFCKQREIAGYFTCSAIEDPTIKHPFEFLANKLVSFHRG